MEQFLSRHQKAIVGVLSGFDRMIFRGTLRSISYVNGMDIFLSAHKILLKDFGGFVQRQSARLKQHAETYARRHGRPYLYVASSSVSKEQIAKGIMQRDGITKGLICVLACVEPCQSYEIRKDQTSKKLKLIPALRKCLHFYFYLVDHEIGKSSWTGLRKDIILLCKNSIYEVTIGRCDKVNTRPTLFLKPLVVFVHCIQF